MLKSDARVRDALVQRSQGVPWQNLAAALPGPGAGGVGCPDGNAELANNFLGAYSPACAVRQGSITSNFYRLNLNAVRSRMFQFALKFYF